MRFLAAVFVLITFASGGMAQNILPDQRYVLTQDMDFYGSDRTSLFDTTRAACERACSADDACVAFTFNSRSSACFPKSDISDRQPYAGAQSAEKIVTTTQAQSLARMRVADLTFVKPRDIQSAYGLAQTIGSKFPVNGQSAEAVASAARA